MKRLLGCVLYVLAVSLILAAIVPLIIPIPPPSNTVPVQQLADPDSLFVAVDGVVIHYKVFGAGEPAFILLHGFGASLFSFREVFQPLAMQGTVVAFDRPAYGLTERPLPGSWTGEGPYTVAAAVSYTVGLMDALDIPKAVLVGNSAGGTVAMLTALQHPERVEALVLLAPAVYQTGGPNWLSPLLKLPQVRRLGPLFLRLLPLNGDRLIATAWHDPSLITADVYAGYRKPLMADHWDVALWQANLASRPLDLADRLNGLNLPVLVITGDDDRWVGTDNSIRLAGELPNGTLVVIPNCGHVPQEECPEAVLEAMDEFLNRALEELP